MLTELMLRNDLTHAEHRVLYLLYAVRANAENGLCFTTDARIAEDLGLTKRSVERTKASLKAKGLLSWTTDRLRGANSVTVYNLRHTDAGVGEPTPASVNDADAHVGQPTKHTDVDVRPMPTPTSAKLSNNYKKISTDTGVGIDARVGNSFYAAFGSPELEAWDRWSKITKGKSLPRDRAGGWNVSQQWPPKITMSLADLLAT